MKHSMLPRLGATLLFLALAASASAQVTVSVFPTLAPNTYGSPSMGAWTSNDIITIYNTATSGGSYASMSGGAAGTPSYFSVAPAVILPGQNMVTTFASWNGQANPGTVFGSAFASEYGNRLHFSFLVDGKGQKVSISQLSFVLTSSATAPDNDLKYSADAGHYQYGTDYVGVLFGKDNALGGGDDSFITAGDDTQQADMLIGRGSGNAWTVKSSATDPLLLQQAIDTKIASVSANTPIYLTGTYTMALADETSVTGTNFVTVIPEPATYAAFFALGTLAVSLFLKRRKAGA